MITLEKEYMFKNAGVEIRYVDETHVFLVAFYRNCEIEQEVFNFFLQECSGENFGLKH